MMTSIGSVVGTHHIAVISFAFLWVSQDRIGLADLCEPVGCLGIVSVAVRVCFLGEDVELAL